MEYSSDPLSSQALAKGDVVKLHIGAHIDGFAAISAETLVVGASESDPVTGPRAYALKAAWHAAEVAMRLIKVGNKNWAVTEAVGKVTAAWDCKPVEGERRSLLLFASFFCVDGSGRCVDRVDGLQVCCRASKRKMSSMGRSVSS